MREWIKLFEVQALTPYLDDMEDDGDPAYEAQLQTEAKIREFCEKEVGLTFYDQKYPISYDPAYDEITIQPDNEEIELDQLVKLAVLGKVTMVASSREMSLTIRIKTTPGLTIS